MRSLPDKPGLRYLKLEAKRRLPDAEFPALHHAHASIAHEHGLPSWTALKHVIGEPDDPDNPSVPLDSIDERLVKR
jgi:hypothetical protein